MDEQDWSEGLVASAGGLRAAVQATRVWAAASGLLYLGMSAVLLHQSGEVLASAYAGYGLVPFVPCVVGLASVVVLARRVRQARQLHSAFEGRAEGVAGVLSVQVRLVDALLLTAVTVPGVWVGVAAAWRWLAGTGVLELTAG